MFSRFHVLLVSALALASLPHCGSSGGTGEAAAGGETSPRGGSAGNFSVDAAGAADDCEREVSFQPVVLGEPAPFDLIIVADHSDSLAWSRDELAAGLGELLTNVKGRSLRIFLLTPTQYGASSAAARNPLNGDAIVSWQAPATLTAFAPAMTEYAQTCNDEAGAIIDCPEPGPGVPHEVHGAWEFSLPQPLALISPEQSEAEFRAAQQAVAAAILALGGSGSPEEQPLCTLARYVSQDSANLPANAVFLLITDEDDVSLPDDCLTGYEGELSAYEVEIGTSPCNSDCDAFRFVMDGTYNWERHAFRCQAYADTGEPIPGTEMMSWYNLGYLASCADLDAGPCTEQEKAAIQPFCDSGLLVASCERECASREQTCVVDLPDPGVDACTESFSYNGQTWENLVAMCTERGSDWSACTGSGVYIEREERYSGSTRRIPLMPGMTTAAIGDYFRSQAEAAFGDGHYLVEAIVFDPAFSCELGAGQSHAANIARMIDAPEQLFPICEPYALALAGVLDFAQTLIQTEFELSLKNDEHVTSVVVIGADGAERTLPADQYSYDEASNLFRIEKSAINGTDKDLRVEVTSDCRPIVR